MKKKLLEPEFIDTNFENYILIYKDLPTFGTLSNKRNNLFAHKKNKEIMKMKRLLRKTLKRKVVLKKELFKNTKLN